MFQRLMVVIVVMSGLISSAMLLADTKAAPELKDVKFGDITAHTITLKAKKGKASITIAAMDYGVGMWVNSGKGDEGVCIVAQETAGLQPYVGFFGKDFRDTLGCPIAISADGVQLTTGKNKGEYKYLTLPELLKLVSK